MLEASRMLKMIPHIIAFVPGRRQIKKHIPVSSSKDFLYFVVVWHHLPLPFWTQSRPSRPAPILQGCSVVRLFWKKLKIITREVSGGVCLGWGVADITKVLTFPSSISSTLAMKLALRIIDQNCWKEKRTNKVDSTPGIIDHQVLTPFCMGCFKLAK